MSTRRDRQQLRWPSVFSDPEDKRILMNLRGDDEEEMRIPFGTSLISGMIYVVLYVSFFLARGR
jgi:hypothetical protein